MLQRVICFLSIHSWYRKKRILEISLCGDLCYMDWETCAWCGKSRIRFTFSGEAS